MNAVVPIHYEDIVKYPIMDAVKRLMQARAAQTYANLEFDTSLVLKSKGGSVMLYRESNYYYRGLVLEQLGTKNLVAEAMNELTGRSYFYNTAMDTAATIFNDIATAGLHPQMGVMFIGSGSEKWFSDIACVDDYAAGWQAAFDEVGCVWGGGETGTLGDLVLPETAVLGGAVIGRCRPDQVLLPTLMKHGDRIVILASNGVHANGLSALRKLAADRGRLPDGYLTELPDGRTFGESILDCAPLYGPVIERAQAHKRKIHWAINISGHAYRKLMRAPQAFRYVVEKLPPRQPIFDFMQEKLGESDKGMLGTYNCGGGYALIVPPEHASGVVEDSESLGISALDAGYIEKVASPDAREVVIERSGIRWGIKDLEI